MTLLDDINRHLSDRSAGASTEDETRLYNALAAIVASPVTTLAVPLPIPYPAPAYSCDACVEGEHRRCTPVVHEVSWQFRCTCRLRYEHFSYEPGVQVPIKDIAVLLGLDPYQPIIVQEEGQEDD